MKEKKAKDTLPFPGLGVDKKLTKRSVFVNHPFHYRSHFKLN